MDTCSILKRRYVEKFTKRLSSIVLSVPTGRPHLLRKSKKYQNFGSQPTLTYSKRRAFTHMPLRGTKSPTTHIHTHIHGLEVNRSLCLCPVDGPTGAPVYPSPSLSLSSAALWSELGQGCCEINELILLAAQDMFYCLTYLSTPA